MSRFNSPRLTLVIDYKLPAELFSQQKKKIKMQIGTNEFENVTQALEAQKEFPFCAVCKSGNKVQVIVGRVFLVCVKNFWHGKHGVKSSWEDK